MEPTDGEVTFGGMPELPDPSRRRTGLLAALGVAALVFAVTAAFVWTFRGSLPDADGAARGTARTYYIAADEICWDYAPERPQPDHGCAVRRGREGVRRRRARPDRQRPTGSAVPASTRTRPSDPQVAAGGLAAPGLPRAGDPRRGGRHHPRRLQEQPGPRGQHPPARRALREGARARPYNDGTTGADKRRRRGAAGSDLHATPAGARAGRPGADGRQLGDVDVPLARRRGRGRQRRPDGPDHHHRTGQARADGRPKDVDREFVGVLPGHRREPEPLLGATSSGSRDPRSDRRTRSSSSPT